jgi:hypothetical protein
MAKSPTLPATGGIIRAAVAAVERIADALGDAGDREAALILDEAAARSRGVLAGRAGQGEKSEKCLRAAIQLCRDSAETLCDADDPEAAMIFAEALGRVNSLLDARAGPPGPEELAAAMEASRRERKAKAEPRRRLIRIRKGVQNSAKCGFRG